MSTRPPYPVDYRFSTADYCSRRERFPGDRLLIPLVQACLEAGMTSSEAVTLAVETHYELDRLARVEDNGKNHPAFTEIQKIRGFVIATLRSGACTSAFEVAARAVGAWRELKKAGAALKKDWVEEEAREKEREKGRAKYQAKVGRGELDVTKPKRPRGRPRKNPV